MNELDWNKLEYISELLKEIPDVLTIEKDFNNSTSKCGWFNCEKDFLRINTFSEKKETIKINTIKIKEYLENIKKSVLIPIWYIYEDKEIQEFHKYHVRLLISLSNTQGNDYFLNKKIQWHNERIKQ